jgi:hypothetical protein
MTKNTKTDATTKQAATKSKKPPMAIARAPKAAAAATIKTNAGAQKGVTNPAVSHVVSPPAVDDPMLAALQAHEQEIARLGGVIIELRGQQVGWINANIGKPPLVVTPSSIEEATTNQDEISRLTDSLGQAWAELETKQAYLQAAMDDCTALQATLDDTTAQRDQAVLANQSLQDQLDLTAKRLSIALEVISRRGYS